MRLIVTKQKRERPDESHAVVAKARKPLAIGTIRRRKDGSLWKKVSFDKWERVHHAIERFEVHDFEHALIDEFVENAVDRISEKLTYAELDDETQEFLRDSAIDAFNWKRGHVKQGEYASATRVAEYVAIKYPEDSSTVHRIIADTVHSMMLHERSAHLGEGFRNMGVFIAHPNEIIQQKKAHVDLQYVMEEQRHLDQFFTHLFETTGGLNFNDRLAFEIISTKDMRRTGAKRNNAAYFMQTIHKIDGEFIRGGIIRVGSEFKNTVAHEMGHALDNKLAGWEKGTRDTHEFKDALWKAYKKTHEFGLVMDQRSASAEWQERLSKHAPTSFQKWHIINANSQMKSLKKQGISADTIAMRESAFITPEERQNTPYWLEPTEIFARAFESWISELKGLPQELRERYSSHRFGEHDWKILKEVVDEWMEYDEVLKALHSIF